MQHNGFICLCRYPSPTVSSPIIVCQQVPALPCARTYRSDRLFSLIICQTSCCNFRRPPNAHETTIRLVVLQSSLTSLYPPKVGFELQGCLDACHALMLSILSPPLSGNTSRQDLPQRCVMFLFRSFSLCGPCLSVSLRAVAGRAEQPL